MHFILKIILTLFLTTSFLTGEEIVIQLDQVDEVSFTSSICPETIKKITIFNQGQKPLIQFFPATELNHKNFKITPLTPTLFEYNSKNYKFLFDHKNPTSLSQWDNQTPLDLESIAEDPLLFFRRSFCQQEMAKKLYEYASMDLFSFIPSSKPILECENLYFDLYPKETLELIIDDGNRASYQIFQKILLSERENLFCCKMPFPILTVKNESSHSIFIQELNVAIEPLQTYCLDEPFFVLTLSKAEEAEGVVKITSKAPICTFPQFGASLDCLHLYAHNETIITICIEQSEACPDYFVKPDIQMVKEENDLVFYLPLDGKFEYLEWKIFSALPQQAASFFQHKQLNLKSIRLPLLLNTYFEANQEYLLSFRGISQSESTPWSTPYPFKISKPQPPRKVEFNKNEENGYHLSWEQAEEGCRYWVFGSNSINFIPSIYMEQEISTVCADGQIQSSKLANNLVQIVENTEVQLSNLFPFYRVIAEKDGQFSNPSPLLYLYDKDLNLKRTCHKIFSPSQPVAKEAVIQSIYPSNTSFLSQYLPSPYIDPFVWSFVQPYLLPENHPVKYKLDRLFTSARITLNGESLRLAGFENHIAGLYSGAVVTRHPKVKGYYFKMFTDDSPQRVDWQQWVTRIQGAQSVKNAIALKGYKKMFKVPEK